MKNSNMPHLLIVEDDKVDQMAFERFAKTTDLPFSYQMVGSIQKAREAIKHGKFDLLVSDFFLGDGTAFDILLDLLEVPMIVVTGTGSEEIAVEAMKKGAFDYLIKDVDGQYLKMLPITVQNALHRFQIAHDLKNHQTNLEKLVEERTQELKKEIEVRKKAEKQLSVTLAREKILADIVRSAPVGIAFIYPDGRLENCNTSFLELTGYSSEELKSVHWNRQLTPVKWMTVEHEILQTLQPTQNSIRYEKEQKRKDGTIIPVELLVTANFDDAGNLIHYIGK